MMSASPSFSPLTSTASLTSMTQIYQTNTSIAGADPVVIAALPTTSEPTNDTVTYISNVTNGILNTTAVTADFTNSTLTPNSTTYPPQPVSPYEPWQIVVIAIILGFLIIGTVLGNCLVCLSVALVKRLQSPSNLLIVSLAVADLCVGMFVMPFAAVKQLYGGSWLLGVTICDIWTTTDVMLCTSSILNLCAISIDRYFVITRPFQYAMKRTPKRMGMMVASVWVISAVVSVPPVFGWKTEPQAWVCIISDDLGYQIYATICAFYLPLTTMICIYFRIWLVSSKIAKAEAKTSKIGSFDKGAVCPGAMGRPSHDSGDSSLMMPNGGILRQNSVTNGGADDDGSLEILPKKLEPDRNARRRFTIRSLLPRNSKSSNQKESKATKTLGIIMGCFTMCWLPFFIVVIILTVCGHTQTECIPVEWLFIADILNWLGYCNSFLNPVIYARFNRDFRTPFKEILMLRCRGINARMRSESYVDQYGPVHSHRDSLRPPPMPIVSHRDSLRPPTESVVRYNSQGQTVVAVGNGSANGANHGPDRETRI